MPQKEEKKVIQIEYKSVVKKVNPLKEVLDSIPKQFFPTAKTMYIFLAIFILVLGWGIVVAILPIADINFDPMAQEAEPLTLEIHAGWPMQFFGTPKGSDDMDIQISIWGGFVDLVLYMLVAYIIDILINFMKTIKLGPTDDELRRRPKTFKFREKSASEKVAEKVVESVAKKEGGQQIQNKASQKSQQEQKPNNTQTKNNTNEQTGQNNNQKAN